MERQIANIIDNETQLLELFSRIDNGKFSTINSDNLSMIISGLDEVNRATKSFGKKDSQTFSKLTSLTMVASSPYGRLKQCLAIIEKKRSALRDNLFLMKKQLNILSRLNVEKQNVKDDVFKDVERQRLDIETDEITCKMSDAILYVEGAIKELGSYQDAYFQIKEKHNIPDDWSESHYEECEVEEHIKLAFHHAVRDVTMTGRINVGTQEYLEQFGIHPLEADKIVNHYIADLRKIEKRIDIDSLYVFLDDVAVRYRNEHKKCIERIGITNLVTKGLLYGGKS